MRKIDEGDVRRVVRRGEEKQGGGKGVECWIGKCWR